MFAPPPYVNTFTRRIGIVRGRLHNDADAAQSVARRGVQRANERERIILQMLNGDVRDPNVLVHFENGCCVDENGFFDRDKIESNMATAITVTGLLGDELPGEPSKNRWGTLSEFAAEQCLGEMIHRIHPRCVDLSFNSWAGTDLPNEEDHDCNKSKNIRKARESSTSSMAMWHV